MPLTSMFSQGHKSWTLGNYYKQFLKILVDNPQYLCKFHKKKYKGRSSPRSPLQAVDNPGWVRQPQPSRFVGQTNQLDHFRTSLRGKFLMILDDRTWLKPKIVTTAKHNLFIGKNIWYKHYRIDHDHGSIIVYMGNESLNMATAKHHLCLGKNIW